MYDFPSSPAADQECTPSGGVTYIYKAPTWTVKGGVAYAPIASPALTGNPTAPTPTAGDNDTSIATTAFVANAAAAVVVPPATVAPLINGTAAVGTTTKYAREDHIHPTDTTRVAKTGDSMTGDLALAKASPHLDLKKTASGQANNIYGYLNTAARWGIELGDDAAETGSNVGSDFVIRRANDAGSIIDAPLIISRANGTIFMAAVNVASTANFAATTNFASGTTINAGGDYVNATAGAHYIGATNAAGTLIFLAGNGSTPRLVIASDGGITAGNPTGGSKGAGTLNATAVYDDNVLLTCAGVQHLKTGAVDVAQWDALSPTGKHPVVRKLAELLDEGFDPRDPKQFVARMLKDEALPGMPSKRDWQQNEISTGEMISRLWLAVELLASAFAGAVARLEQVEKPK